MAALSAVLLRCCRGWHLPSAAVGRSAGMEGRRKICAGDAGRVLLVFLSVGGIVACSAGGVSDVQVELRPLARWCMQL